MENIKSIPATKYGRYTRNVLAFYIPLLARLPSLREDDKFMEQDVKATGQAGVDDVVTKADIWMQGEIKNHIRQAYPGWQFWGEEGDDSNKQLDTSKEYLFITDPIEGTNNFRFFKDEYWGSVVALVDMPTQKPVIGIIAQPIKKRLFVGIKNEGAFVVSYNDNGEITNTTRMNNQPEYDFFTYNNSPHFEPHLLKQVDRFFGLGKVQPDTEGADELDRSRKDVLLPYDKKQVKFVDVECGALEPVLFCGVIMFKTNIEMAAVFAIAPEIGAIVADSEGKPWSIETNTLIFGRNKKDWQYLKDIYDKTL